ncbi:MAG: hypothetical protein ABR499_12890, partial [Gemmatimonadaceae bacterium]
LAHDTGMIGGDRHRELADALLIVQRMLARLIVRLRELDRFRRRRRPSQAHKPTSSQATAVPARAD